MAYEFEMNNNKKNNLTAPYKNCSKFRGAALKTWKDL